MPQMAPISWLILFVVFSIAFMMFNVVNYFCFFNKNKNSLNVSDSKIINDQTNNKNTWKW